MTRLLVVLVMLAGLTGGPRSALPLALAGSPSQQQDACPEPNDEFQAACSFGGGAEVLGYIGHPDDVDAYRFEALDFDATASVVVPFPYQAAIADWRGDVVAASTSIVGDGELVAAPLLLPGTYYVFVRSRTGDVNADQPYRLAISLEYAGRPARPVLYQSDYRAGRADRHDAQPDVDYTRAGGKLSMTLKTAGSPARAATGHWDLATAPQSFAVTADTRATGGSNAGFRVVFGQTDAGQNYYSLVVSAGLGQATLFRMVDGRVVPIVDWVLIPAIDRQGGVNRVVVRVDGGEIRANVNGQDLFTATGQQVPPGLVGVTAMSWAEPATVSFDNVLVTSAETVQAAPGTSLLRESFEDPSRPLYGALSQAPDQYDFAYVGGILRARRLAENGTAIVLLPYNVDHDHATIAVTARLADQVEGRYLILGCRRHDVPAQTGYRLAVSPVSGTFTIVRWDSNVEVPLISWQESPAIQRDAEWNRLELTCTGSTIEASANGQVLGSVQDGTYPQGQSLMGVGVFAGQGAPAEAYFDDLEVTRR